MQTVNACGLTCPQPLILAKKALSETSVGASFTILVDNLSSRQNVERFLRDQQAEVRTTETQGFFELTVTKHKDVASGTTDPEAYCEATPPTPAFVSRGRQVMVFKSDQMGMGDATLGKMLIQACIHTIKEVSPLPNALLFYNAGIHLVTAGSPVLSALKALEEQGVELLSCGACLDFYQQKDQLQAGRVSNMYEILSRIVQATSVIYP